MGRPDEIAAMRELGVAWCTEAQFAALLDERDRLLADRDEALALLRRTPNPYDYGDSELRGRCTDHHAEVAAFIARVDGEGGDRG